MFNRLIYSLNSLKVMFKLQLLLFMLIPIAYCAVFRTIIPVTDEKLRQMGYSCVSHDPNLGLLRDGEIKSGYDGKCVQATCNNGEIVYHTCGSLKVLQPKTNCMEKYKQDNRPYPDCCIPIGCD